MKGQANMRTGPVSAALEADLRTQVRRHGIVVWLDTNDHYSAFVDELADRRKRGELSYDVRAYRQSHLELMLALEGIAAGAHSVPLLVHLPGFNEDSVRKTPHYELYAAGIRYRKALDTLITEAAGTRVRPDQIAAFVAEPDLTLARADAWLAALVDAGEGGLGETLAAMKPTAVLDDLLGGHFVAKRMADPDHRRALWERLSAWTGLPDSWRQTTSLPTSPRAEDVAFCAASWALCVEYVDDLARAPVSPHLRDARDLPPAVIACCQEIAAHLRGQHPRFYERTADETEVLLSDEVNIARAEDLGKIDTFRFEEDKVLKAALVALGERAWDVAFAWATLRIDPDAGSASFWLGEERARKRAWKLIADAAKLGLAIAAAGERLEAQGLEGAIAAYVSRGAAVDNAHRHLEQRRTAQLSPQLPEFETLRARLDDMRIVWRAWADAWARDFSRLCRECGFLPAASLSQRTLFDDVVKPMTQEPGTTAFFMVDAWRFEMGEELYRQLADTTATNARLSARLCELPSVTEVGMNVLAPVCENGRLEPALSTADGGKVLGFATGEFRVHDPETRKRAMHDRVGGTTCPLISLDEVISRETVSLRRTVAKARLLVVHSEEIDKAGESGNGLSVFDDAMHKLRVAWRLLRDAGVRRFVLTSDHGFLLLDNAAATAKVHGRKIDPKRRHVFSPVAADHDGEARVALSELGYDGVEGHVMFPESCAVFDTGKKKRTFVHGGNSLQERVIPVLTVVHRAPAGGNTLSYGIVAKALKGITDMHRIEAKVDVLAQHALDFGSANTIELSLRVPDEGDVQVELCDVDGNARLAGGVVEATVGEPFELFFRLTGASDARARVELSSDGANVEPCTPDARFAVTATGALPAATAPAPASDESWLEELPAGGVRDVFAHLAAYGAATEDQVIAMLGSARAARRFARQFETLAAKAPFVAKLKSVAGVKRYVREGSE